ncbi:hypothetical protein LRR18_18180, partial [Mangrovimonas sp. AS39]|uniref:hypothetical protein n=1 Tax=Mangrovimonas futianensis TaxID=2895523 RepID=UPI001E4F3658
TGVEFGSINDASYTDKGVSSFSSVNFTVTSGSVNTVQNISSTASPTFNSLNLNGNTITINADSTSSGSDWKFIIQRPTSGMVSNLTWYLPVSNGT